MPALFWGYFINLSVNFESFASGPRIFERVESISQDEQDDALIGGESSGGLTVRGHISGKDGLYAASLLVEMISVTRKPLSQLVQEIYDEYGEMHMAEYDWALTEESKKEIQQRILTDKQLPTFDRAISKVSYMDGCKVYFEEGWIIVRFSGTEPRVRVFAEARKLREAKELVRVMADFCNLPFED